MNKMLLFFVVVIVAVFGTLLFLNQKNVSSTSPLEKANSLNTPTPGPISISVPQTSPGSETPTGYQLPSLTPQAQEPVQQPTSAMITTTKGDITLQLYPEDAPKTVANFAKKSQSGFYTNKIFHRVEGWVIQGGDPLGNGTGGGDMPTELNSKPFVVGSLGVARGGDIKISNDSQFFITKTEASWLTKQYTNFGVVTEGMDVVNKIEIGDKILKITVQ